MAEPPEELGQTDLEKEAIEFGELQDSVAFHLRVVYEACVDDLRPRLRDAHVEEEIGGQAVEKRGRASSRAGGLDVNHLSFLALILANPGMTQRELGKAAVRDKSSVTIALKELEELGLVERVRDARDRRYYRSYLSDKGRAFCDGTFKRVLDQHKRRVASMLGDEETGQLLGLLKRLRAAFDASSIEAPSDK
ncbi:MarR family winged helix-turn-helix transcriptional regulator [Amorphus sp. 3PC139-8]|uniref:MarR family winged helix-turn-helix transcriptional regulator n=1 Tax=Amorphus sp. 3PC139-8 TaxID=2735676 RepID=UPI00345CC7F6